MKLPVWVATLIHVAFVLVQGIVPPLVHMNPIQHAAFSVALSAMQGVFGVKVKTVAPIWAMTSNTGIAIHGLFVAIQMAVPTLPWYLMQPDKVQSAVTGGLAAVQGFFGVAINHDGDDNASAPATKEQK